jgi:hypothetical protein
VRTSTSLRGRLSPLSSALAAALAVSAAAGCIGNIGERTEGGIDPGGTPGVDPQCASAAPDTEPVLVRMLNRREYANTVRDLLGVTVDVAEEFPADPIVAFDNHADSLVASSILVEKQLDAAEAAVASADLAAIVPCASADDCVDELIADFGRRAFRRPLTDAEALAMRGIFDAAKAAGRDTDHSVRLVVEGMLMSPQFLYRTETTRSATGGVVPVEPYELASRLSYFFWASMPDAELLDAAEAGELATPEQVEEQARRMIGDPRAHEVTRAFHQLWLELYKLPSTTKDAALYPGFEPLLASFGEETTRFAEWVFWESGGGAGDLLLSNTGFRNEALAAHYGESGSAGEALEQVELSGNERFGLLSQASILAMFSNPDRTSPTRRGKFVRGQLLCQPPPPPPADVPPLENNGPAEGTLRERLSEHVSNPACKGCHELLDPVGFGLENYDTVGRYRSEEAAAPVDASGELIGVETGGGTFVGGRELSEHLAATEEFYACVATQWFRFAVGREEGDRDACTVSQIQAEFRQSGDLMPELLVAIARSDAFLLKNTEQSQ